MSRSRKLLGIPLLVAVMLVVAGCGSVFGGGESGGGESASGGGGDSSTLNVNLGADIPDMDPSTSTDAVASDVMTNINEGLYRLDDELEPQPAMAEDVEISDDDLTYTFTLKDDITWSNGDPLTSEDFAYGWLRTLDPETASEYSFIISDYIEGGEDYVNEEGSREDVAIETPDEQTLEVTLTQPTPYFLGLTAFKQYAPQQQEFVEEQGGDYAQGADSLLYNGPYEMTEFNSSEGVTLEKRDDYWDADSVDIETVDATIVKDEQTALRLYQSGELDRTGLTSEQVEEYRDDPEFSTYTEFASWWFTYNFEDPVMQNEDIRRALQRGVDREALADTVLNNGSEGSTGIVPPEMSGPGDEAFREAYGSVAPEFDPDEAQQSYEQGVEELGEEPTLTVLTGDTSTSRNISTFVQGQLQENLGADVEIEQVPFDERLDRTTEGDFQFTIFGWIADYDDPSSFMDLFTTDSSFNDGSFSNERYDELVNGAATETDEQERMDMYAEAEELLLQEEAAVGPLYFDGTAILTKPYLQNAEPRPYGGATWYEYELEEQG